MPLSACNDRSATSVERAAFVHTEIVQPQDGDKLAAYQVAFIKPAAIPASATC